MIVIIFNSTKQKMMIHRSHQNKLLRHMLLSKPILVKLPNGLQACVKNVLNVVTVVLINSKMYNTNKFKKLTHTIKFKHKKGGVIKISHL